MKNYRTNLLALISILTFHFAFTSTLEAQGIWSSPGNVKFQPLTWNVHFFSDSIGCVSSDSGKIARTVNAGYSWSDISPNYSIPIGTNHYRSICSFNDSIVFAISLDIDSDSMIRTFDGGGTWDKIGLPTRFQHYLIFNKDSSGLLAGVSGVFETKDLGLNWNKLTTLPVRQVVKKTNGDYYAGLGNSYYIVRSTSNGTTWDSIKTGVRNPGPIHFINNKLGMVGGDRGYYAITEDGGDTWVTKRLADTSYQITDLYGVNPNLIFGITGNRNAIIEFSDRGNSYRYRPTGIACSGMTGLSFPSKMRGYAVGLGNRISIFRGDSSLIWNDTTKTEDTLSAYYTNQTVEVACNIFPNPAYSQVTIQSGIIIKEINLYNNLGEMVKTVFPKNENSIVEIGDLENGFYILEVMNDSGSVIRKRLVISH